MYRELFAHKAKGSQLSFSIQFDPSEVLPYTVQYGGGGHYFQTVTDAVNYTRQRKWITAAQAEKILRELDRKWDE